MSKQHVSDEPGMGLSGLPPSVLRARMVERLRASGVLRDALVERALATVPRHRFLPGLPLDQAYADIAVPTHFDGDTPISSASQPAIVAIMLQQLQPFAGMRVLEIGAGTGYNAALLAELVGPAGRVTTVDIDAVIADEARAHLEGAGYPTVRVVAADGAGGWPDGAPYDRIELTVGTSDLSPAWVAQLKDGGMLVMPLWLGTTDASVAFRKHGDTFTSEALTPCGFMRLRGQETDLAHWASLPGGWRLASGRAAALAAPVARLLKTRPRRRLWPHQTLAFVQYLGLRPLDLVALWPEAKRKPRRCIRGRYGLYAEGADGPSLCLFSPPLPVLLIFGGTAAEHALQREMAAWQTTRASPLDQWQVTAHPRDAIQGIAMPDGAVRLVRRHYVFDIQLAPPRP
ncbi:MAG: methyltransferase domain-containing protein [Ktedonobacterales bacterium]|nr:methyltransferase domain-containing protein [Ktedonobacterales bacterium]